MSKQIAAEVLARDNSSRVEFELPMLEVWVRVPVVAILYLLHYSFATSM